MDEPIILKRNCEAVLIPAGTKVTLQAGEPVTITQALGGSYTVIIHGNMARIAGDDADALGKETLPPAPAASTSGAQGLPAADGQGAKPETLKEEEILNTLRTCYDPEIPVNIVDLGLVYDLQILPLPGAGHRVEIKMTLTAPGCGMGPVLQQDVESKVLALPGVKEAAVFLVWEPQWNREMLSDAAKLQLGLM
jgi:probable FeS assembly SUF system protein SufT